MAVGDYTGIHFVLLRVVNVVPIPKRVHELSYDYSYMLNRFLLNSLCHCQYPSSCFRHQPTCFEVGTSLFVELCPMATLAAWG